AGEVREWPPRMVRNPLFLNVLTGVAGVTVAFVFRDALVARLFKPGHAEAAEAARMLMLFAASWPLSQMQGTLAAVDMGRLTFRSWAIKANVTTLILLTVLVTAAALTNSPMATAAARLVAVAMCVALWGAGVARTLGWRA